TILKGLAEADVVITTGGVSVGDYDILVDLFEQWQGELLFNKIAMRPGSPTSVGVLDGKLLFALSGNPGACHVSFELFVRPALMKLQGIDHGFRPTFTATLTADYTKGIAFTRLIRGKSYIENGKAFVDPVGKDQSSMMVSIKDSNCLIIIPPGGRGKIAGDSVTVIQLNER
ncbi:MAG: molybdopterin-binding protein, partial [Bacilli bacterium]